MAPTGWSRPGWQVRAELPLRPDSLIAESDGSLRISRAEEVIFGWHYYGQPQIEENWCEDRYRLDGDHVTHVVIGPIRSARGLSFPERFPYPGEPFVRIARIGSAIAMPGDRKR